MPDPFNTLVDDCQAGLDLLDRQRALRKSVTGASSFGGVGNARRPSTGVRDIPDWGRLGAELRALGATVAATSGATAKLTAEVRRDRLRQGVTDIMAKADALFAEGKMGGDDLRRIEARVHGVAEAFRL